MVIEKIKVAKPPSELLSQCSMPSQRVFLTNRDIVENRLDWINAYFDCESKQKRLVEWIND